MTKTILNIQNIINKVQNKIRLDKPELLELFTRSDLLEFGFIANFIRKQYHPDSEPVTFVVDRNINYTNICSCECKFCAFHKKQGASDGYVLRYDEIKSKLEELVSCNGTQLLLQGGLNEDINLDYYLNLLSNIKKDFPGLSIHAFSPPEIEFIARNNNLSIEELLKSFIDAGLSSIPGGGAEILSDTIRQLLSPNKITAQQWLDVMEMAHRLNLKTTATMMAGSIESKADIVDHLIKIRDLQDKTRGFTAFIPWSFQSHKTEIKPIKLFTGMDYLRLIAISRIALDNIENIQVSWPTQGIKLAQIALNFGANDFGGTMMEENVLASTGLKIVSSREMIVNTIKSMNRIPAQRDTYYNILKIFD